MSLGWRGPVAALLVAGLVGGYAARLTLTRDPAEAGVAQPVVASPTIPGDPPPLIVEDPAVAPLPVGLETRRTRFRTPGASFTYPRPRGWVLTRSGDDEKWRDPAITVAYTYVLRVRRTSDNETVTRKLEDRVRDLESDEEHVEWLGRTEDSLSFSYVDSGHRRFGLLQWVRLPGSRFADVEVAVTGREVDQAGLRALLDTVVAGVRQS